MVKSADVVKPALEELKREGLVEVTPGKPRGVGRAATEIKRILPIPEVF